VQVIDLPAKKVFGFLFKTIIITTLIVALTHVYRIVDSKNGLPVILPALFPEMEISNNGMFTKNKTPYVVNAAHFKDFLSVLYDTPESLFHIQDSTIVVDTRADFKLDKKSSAGCFMSSQAIHVHFGRNTFISIPYSMLVKENEVVRFDKEGISGYLKKQSPKLFLTFAFPYHLIKFIIIIVTSIFFLAFAAFILRVGQTYRMKMMLKIAAFAISPLAIERVLSSLAGAKIIWMWHVAIFISLVILYRANKYLSKKNNKTSPGEK
jgi:hypothetical protein